MAWTKVMVFFVCLSMTPAGSLRAWDAGPPECMQGFCSGGQKPDLRLPNTKWRGNTHLFIAAYAIQLLLSKTDPTAQSIGSALSQRTCYLDIARGLWNADGDQLSDPKIKGSHFYNAAGLDFLGAATSVVTYLKLGTEQKDDGDGRDNALKYLKLAREQPNDRCYYVGLALHYVTDMTQPMHASGFSAISGSPTSSIPDFLHVMYEAYVPLLHQKAEAKFLAADFSGLNPLLWPGESQAAMIDDISKRSNSSAQALLTALRGPQGPSRQECVYDAGEVDPAAVIDRASTLTLSYNGYCFREDPKVDELTITLLSEAVQSTASFMTTLAPIFATVSSTTRALDAHRPVTLRGDGGSLSASSGSSLYATFGSQAEAHFLRIRPSNIILRVRPDDGSVVSGDVVHIETTNPDPAYKTYKFLRAPKTANASYYTTDADDLLQYWIIWKANQPNTVGFPINAGDAVWIENKSWRGKYLKPYPGSTENYVGVLESYSWFLDQKNAAPESRPLVQPLQITPSATCQALSDANAIVANAGFGFAPDAVRQLWIAQNCNTRPSSDKVAGLCQVMSNQFHISPGDFGSADSDVRGSWTAMGCNTKPVEVGASCQERSDAFAIFAGLSSGLAPQSVATQFAKDNCNTDPSPSKFVGLCQEIRSRFGVQLPNSLSIRIDNAEGRRSWELMNCR